MSSLMGKLSAARCHLVADVFGAGSFPLLDFRTSRRSFISSSVVFPVHDVINAVSRPGVRLRKLSSSRLPGDVAAASGHVTPSRRSVWYFLDDQYISRGIHIAIDTDAKTRVILFNSMRNILVPLLFNFYLFICSFISREISTGRITVSFFFFSPLRFLFSIR